ncbi:MAG: M48 family metallopeptidase [Tannerella sp.]|jgi:heat shock protein HtpX|nr:M48 family metallopeptidase [Tannerella sp.]
MEYVGIQTQQRRNNLRSAALLCLFPCLIVGLTWLGCYLFASYNGGASAYSGIGGPILSSTALASSYFFGILPIVVGGVLIWFLIAYFANVGIIQHATDARPLERMENKRVYNLVENLCMSQGMPMPKINVIDDESLNAFASGINNKTYTVTLTSGIIDKLNDEELEGVIGHELTHIRNRDVRLLIISIVFVGIFTALAQLGFRTLLYAPSGRSRSSDDRNGKSNGGGVIVMLLIVLLVALIGYFFSLLLRFAISKKREYMADAGSAEMTKNPLALASALRKISADPLVEAVKRKDVAQLFIEDPQEEHMSLSNPFGLFSSHPPIEKRIAILEQF